MVGAGEPRDRDRRLRLPVDLAEDGAERLQVRDEVVAVHRRPTVDDVLEDRELSGAAQLLLQQPADHRRRQEGDVGGAQPLDRAEQLLGLVAP